MKQLFIFFSLIFISYNSLALNNLNNIGFSTMPGNKVQIQLDFTGTDITYTQFSTDKPARIILDFPNTKMTIKDKYQAIGIGAVQGIQVIETHNRMRVVLKLVRMVAFDINIINKRALISINNASSRSLDPSRSPNAASTKMVPKIAPAPKAQIVTLKPTTNQPIWSAGSSRPLLNTASQTTLIPPARHRFIKESISPPSPHFMAEPLAPHIKNVDFRRTPEGIGRIEITLSNENIVVDMHSESGHVILDFLNTILLKRLDRRLDVLDFGTPINLIDTFAMGNHTRMKVTAIGNFEYHAYQTENTYILEVKEKIEIQNDKTKIEERKYEGQVVSFDFQKIDVRAVLSLLFGLPGIKFNMVASDKVTGSISLRLKNVPWDQALDIILEARDLGMRKVGNVIMIDLKKNIDERKQSALKANEKIKALEPLYTEFIVINYAKVSDIAQLLTNKNKSDNSLISARGGVSMDKRTNTLIILETADKITEIRRLITALDTPIRQVLIEAKIVIATSNFSKDLGVKFGYSANEDLGLGNGIVFGGKVSGDTAFSSGTAFSSENTLTGAGQGENFIVSLPAAVASPAAVGLAIGKIGSYLLQLELSAMQSEGTGEVLSSPRVITGNQQEAIIMQGTEIPYVEPAGIGAVSQVQFKAVVLELKVTPQITPDARVNLTLEVKKDSESGRYNGIPGIATRQVKTTVLVDNGETVVLGGVYERTTSDSLDKVPFLADLPFIGELFKRRSSQDQKSELLIFVTPKILAENS